MIVEIRVVVLQYPRYCSRGEAERKSGQGCRGARNAGRGAPTTAGKREGFSF
jgi:hypothetical protein